MRFVDSNVFLYAIIKPKKKPSEKIILIKDKAKKIFKRINEGEKVITTVVHLSEVANVLEDIAGIEFASEFISDVLTKENIEVVSIDGKTYLASSILAQEKNISINDALAFLVMRQRKIDEIYSFDKHFDVLPIKRKTE